MGTDPDISEGGIRELNSPDKFGQQLQHGTLNSPGKYLLQPVNIVKSSLADLQAGVASGE